jgi:hypothetical protein
LLVGKTLQLVVLMLLVVLVAVGDIIAYAGAGWPPAVGIDIASGQRSSAGAGAGGASAIGWRAKPYTVDGKEAALVVASEQKATATGGGWLPVAVAVACGQRVVAADVGGVDLGGDFGGVIACGGACRRPVVAAREQRAAVCGADVGDYDFALVGIGWRPAIVILALGGGLVLVLVMLVLL